MRQLEYPPGAATSFGVILLEVERFASCRFAMHVAPSIELFSLSVID